MIRIPAINIIHGDCMGLMQATPDKAYDLAIVDPPYGINVGENRFGENKKRGILRKYLDGKSWDNDIPTDVYFEELFRISKNQIICGGNYFALPPTRGFVFWYKSSQMKGRDFAEGEYIWTSFDCNARQFELSPITGKPTDKIHPTQKPVTLYKWLLTNYANPGDRILDTHGGSMSHAIACYDLGFNLDIIELDADYYAAGKARFERHIAQGQLFHVAAPQPQQAVLFE